MGSAAKERSFERLKRSSTTERIFFGVSWNVLNLGYLFAPFLLFIFIYFSLYLSNDFLLRPLCLFFIRFIVFCFLSCLSWKLACVPPSVAVAFAVTVLPHFYPSSQTPSSPFPPLLLLLLLLLLLSYSPMTQCSHHLLYRLPLLLFTSTSLHPIFSICSL